MSVRKRFILFMSICLALSILLFYLSLTTGTYSLTIKDLYQLFVYPTDDSQGELVLFEFRLPRIWLAILVGSSLGVVGAILQGITKNDLADPGILGIQSAVGFMIVLSMYSITWLPWLSHWFSPMLFGWLGGIIASISLFLFSFYRGEVDPRRLILVGIALNSGFSAGILFISLKMNPQDFEMATIWLSGSFYGASWNQVYSLLPWFCSIVPFFLFISSMLNIIQFDEVTIKSLGVRLPLLRMLFLVGSVGLISATVVVSGNIAFVGLLAPHISKKLIGHHYAYVLLLSMMIGAILLMVSDLLGRTLVTPAEIPVGIIVSVIGAPYFLYIFMKQTQFVSK